MVRSTDGSFVPPFLTKCYDMVDDEATDALISWSPSHDSFVIWDLTVFSTQVLPMFFKHNNMASFVRQLNIYGFRKVNTDRWEFASENFVKGKKHLLKNISRKKNSQVNDQQTLCQVKETPSGAYQESGNFKLLKEVETLKTDKNALEQELIILRQHQATSEKKLLLLKKRLQGMEKDQQQMLSFLVMAMQSPGFPFQHIFKNVLEQGTEEDRGEPLPSDGMIIKYKPSLDGASRPLLVPALSSEFIPPSDEMKDYLPNTVLDEKLGLAENGEPFVILDPDNGILEQLLDASEMETETIAGGDDQIEKHLAQKIELLSSEINRECESR